MWVVSLTKINSFTIQSVNQFFHTLPLPATLMTRILTLILTNILVLTSAYGQNYWFGFVTSDGDTLNKKDSLGYWQGLHVQMWPWECNKLRDTCSYIIGVYENGQPVGNWMDYKKDGTFSIGHYNTGIEVSPDGRVGYTEKRQGIYTKIGVWRFFDKDSNLLKTERYDRSHNRKGWTNITYFKDSAGNFILREYEFMNKKDLNSPFKVIIHNYYFSNGMPSALNKVGFWRTGYTTFYPSGDVVQKHKCVKILGFNTNKSVTKTYDKDGKTLKIDKGKCVTKITDPAW